MSPLSARRPVAAVIALALGSLGAIAVAAPASAASYGAGTEVDLIAAIAAANANPGADTVSLEADIMLTADLPAFTDDVTVTSTGGPWTLDGNAFNALAFSGVIGNEIVASVSNLTVAGAATAVSSAFTDLSITNTTISASGTGINHNTGDLSITDSTVSSNVGTGMFATLTVTDAGVVVDTAFDDNGSTGASFNVNSAASLQLQRVTADRNVNLGLIINAPTDAEVQAEDVSTSDNGGTGLLVTAGGSSNLFLNEVTSSSNGALGIDLTTNDTATIVVSGGSVSQNVGAGLLAVAQDSSVAQFYAVTFDANGGGGVDASASDSAVFVLFLSTVSNVTSGARGIYLESSDDAVTVVANSVVSGNTGGGIQVTNGATTGGLTIIGESTIDGNGTIASPGGGVYVSSPEQMDVVITDSTFSNNTGNIGGGIYVGAGVGTFVQILQVTTSGNTANVGGGLYLESTGITPAAFSVENSTISDNSAAVSSPGAHFDSEDSEISNSIFSGNDGIDLTVIGLAQLDYNLIEAPAANTTVEANKGTGNILGVSANLGALQNNGGPTLTQLPAAGSPAINAGDPAFAAAIDFDQRRDGFDRVVAGRIDIGAVETVAAAPTSLAATGTDPYAGFASAALLAIGGLLALLLTRRRRALS